MARNFTLKTYPSLVAVVHQCVLHAPNGLGAYDVLSLMGYDSYNTGMAELTQEGRKFDADRVLPAMDATGSDAPLHFLARHRGGVFVKTPEAAPCAACLVRALADSIREFGQFAAETATDIADGDITRDQLGRIRKEGCEAIEAIAAMIKTAEAAHEKQYGERT